MQPKGFADECKRVYHRVVADATDDGVTLDDAKSIAIEQIRRDIADQKILQPGDPLADLIGAAIDKADQNASPAVGRFLRKPALAFPDDPLLLTPVKIDSKGGRKALGWCTDVDLAARHQLIADRAKAGADAADDDERLTVRRIKEMHDGKHIRVRSAVLAGAWEPIDGDWFEGDDE